MLWWFAQTTIVAAGLAALAALACRWRRIGPETRHALWLVVLLKLMMPPFVGGPRPRVDRWPALSHSVLSVPVKTDADLNTPLTLSYAESPAISPALPEPSVSPAVTAGPEPLPEIPPLPVADAIAPPDLGLPPDAPAMADIPPESPGPAPAIIPTPIPEVVAVPAPVPFEAEAKGWWAAMPFSWAAMRLWWLGTIAVVGWEVARIARFRRTLKASAPAPAWLVAEVEAVATRFGVRPPPVRVVEGLNTPLLWCLGRPQLYLPSALFGSLSADRWRGVVAHEMAHLARRDHWVARLELAAEALWWWNPLFWAVRRRLRDEAERACDARVVRAWPAERLSYAEALVDVCERLSRPAMPSPALGVVGGSGASRSLERRLSMILRDPITPPAPLRAALAITLLAALALPAWTLGQQPAPPSEPTPPAPALPESIVPPVAPIDVPPPGQPSVGARADITPASTSPIDVPPPGQPSVPAPKAADLTIEAIAEQVRQQSNLMPNLAFRYIVTTRFADHQHEGHAGVGVQVADVALGADQRTRIDMIRANPLPPIDPTDIPLPKWPQHPWERRFLARSPAGIMTLATAWDREGPILLDWQPLQEQMVGMGIPPALNLTASSIPITPSPAEVLDYVGGTALLLNTFARA